MSRQGDRPLAHRRDRADRPAIPICDACKRLWVRRGNRIWAAAGVVAAAAWGLGVYFSEDRSPGKVTQIFLCMAFFTAVAAYAAHRYFGHPVVVSVPSRSGWRFARRRIFFRNPQYAGLVIRANNAR